MFSVVLFIHYHTVFNVSRNFYTYDIRIIPIPIPMPVIEPSAIPVLMGFPR